jgi:hypothetical protein
MAQPALGSGDACQWNSLSAWLMATVDAVPNITQSTPISVKRQGSETAV